MNLSSRKLSGTIAAVSITVASVLVSVGTGPAWAGGGGVGHSHSTKPATKEEILDTSKKVRDKLVSDGKVEITWKAIEPDGAEQKEFKNKKEWVVTFKDPKATDKSKESLYMFFSLTGNYLATNFTGT